MGLYNNATDCNTLSEVSSLEPTIDTLEHIYEESRSVLDSVLISVQYDESGTNVESEMRRTIACITNTYSKFQAAQEAYGTCLSREGVSYVMRGH